MLDNQSNNLIIKLSSRPILKTWICQVLSYNGNVKWQVLLRQTCSVTWSNKCTLTQEGCTWIYFGIKHSSTQLPKADGISDLQLAEWKVPLPGRTKQNVVQMPLTDSFYHCDDNPEDKNLPVKKSPGIWEGQDWLSSDGCELTVSIRVH